MASIDPYGVGADSISARGGCPGRKRARASSRHIRKRADKTYYIVLLYNKADDLAIKKGCRFVKTASVPG